MIKNYQNAENLLQSVGPIEGRKLIREDLDLLKSNVSVPSSLLTLSLPIIVELHVYDLEGNYLDGNHQIQGWKKQSASEISLDVHIDVRKLGFSRGEYKVVYNFLTAGSTPTEFQSQLFYIKEISPSRREIKVALEDQTISLSQLQPFDKESILFQNKKFTLNYIVNFNSNNVFRLINYAKISDTELIIKLYKPLSESIDKKSKFRILHELRRPYIDDILLRPIIIETPANTIRGANFNTDINYGSSAGTDFKSWNDLLGTNTDTSQQLIDRYFGTDLSGIKLNINYCEFSNYVHFSSATERIKNFKYKLDLIEFYDDRLIVLQDATGSVEGNVTETTNKKNAVVSGFDDYERFLYFESGSGIYTHISCSNDPWPKDQADQQARPYTLFRTTSSQAVTYYADLLDRAKTYDRNNLSGLVKSIPEHIRLNASNEQFELFVNMIGQHFDILWTYIEHLTNISSKQEHPKDGVSKDLIFDVAKSMGWTLSHGSKLQSLWAYSLGVDGSGNVQSTGSLASKSSEDLTKEVWRRIVNNLPYLLKTKGTARSIKALISCYGVPSTFLRIKEYGGPAVLTDKPSYIVDKFAYALKLDENTHVTAPWGPMTVANGQTLRTPDTIEIRFKPHDDLKFSYGSYSTSTLLQVGTGTETKFFVTMEQSGSRQKGNINFYLSGSSGYLTASINDIQLFDDQFTSLMITRLTSSDDTTTHNTYDVNVKGIFCGIVNTNKSASIQVNESTAGSGSGSYNTSWASVDTFYLGKGDNPSNTLNFTGSVQELRFWTEPLLESAFETHTLSPTSYSGNNPTASYYDLKLRIPFIFKINHDVSSSLASAHPNQNITEFSGSFPVTASMVGFGTDSSVYYEPIEEKHFIKPPSIGANNLYSDKIRIEENKLIRPLSVNKRGEKSSFDLHPIDSNRIGIYFSPQDVINEDIYDHIGYTELDDYIGDPSDQYKMTYPDLRSFTEEYWKKYTNRNDIAAYLRMFSIFDFSLFKQIDQLLPARVNKITGLLIEPNILERSKYQWKKYDISQLNYLAEIDAIINLKNITSEEKSYFAPLNYTSSFDLSVSKFSDLTANITGSQGSFAKFSSTVNTTKISDTAESFGADLLLSQLKDPAKYLITNLIQSGSQKVYTEVSNSSDNFDAEMVTVMDAPDSLFYNIIVDSGSVAVIAQIPDYKPLGQQQQQFLGSKTSSPAVNVDSTDTVDHGPAVEVTKVDARTLIVRELGAAKGTLDVV